MGPIQSGVRAFVRSIQTNLLVVGRA